jgi:DNA-binding Xre family transcriptional regulator
VKTVKNKNRYSLFLLDRAKKRPSVFASLHPNVASSKTEIRDFVPHATKDSWWVSYASDLTDELVRNASSAMPSLGFGLFLHPLDVEAIPALSSCFRRIAFQTDGKFLTPENLTEVLRTEHRSDLFIGGNVNHTTKTITFWRGNLKPLTAPFSAFGKSGDGTEPDFEDFSVIDYGQTVKLGNYEAAVDAILYEHDPEYRRGLLKKRQQEDSSLGASLRRLRKQRGLRREDFEPGVTAKTVARIEQGKVKRIRKNTRDVLAKRLGVAPEEIENF